MREERTVTVVGGTGNRPRAALPQDRTVKRRSVYLPTSKVFPARSDKADHIPPASAHLELVSETTSPCKPSTHDGSNAFRAQSRTVAPLASPSLFQPRAAPEPQPAPARNDRSRTRQGDRGQKDRRHATRPGSLTVPASGMNKGKNCFRACEPFSTSYCVAWFVSQWVYAGKSASPDNDEKKMSVFSRNPALDS